MHKPKNFQEFIFSLCEYWVQYGCLWSQPYDSQMGAGTFHPHTFLKGLGPEPWKSVYVQPCRRPNDGRYGKSHYRFQHYYQLQVLLKPSPSNIIDIFLQSLEHVGINLRENDIGLLEDDWKGPTLGAWGLGWEVRANGQEVTQFTYFQQLGGLDIDVVCGEITYGLERLYMYANRIKNGLDIPFNENFTWGDIYYQNEVEFSHYNFNDANIPELLRNFETSENNVFKLCEKNLILPAYDEILKASHTFNLLDSRKAISVSERQRYIGRVRDCAKKCASTYKKSREKLGYPLLQKLNQDPRIPIFKNNSHSKEVLDIKTPHLEFQEDNDFKSLDNISLLFELGVEEMPPSFQQSAIEELENKVENYFKSKIEKFKFDPDFVHFLRLIKYKLNISARRISLQILYLPLQEPKQKLEIWGPIERISRNIDGTLTAAGIGFCKKNGLKQSEVQFKLKGESNFLYAQKIINGDYLPTIIAQEFKTWIYSLNAPLKMKWLPSEICPSFIRPVRSLIALVEDKIIPLEMFGILSSNFTYGQRILSKHEIAIRHPKEYEFELKNYFVEINFKKRKENILMRANEICNSIGGILNYDENLLNKCSGLFENPEVFFSKFNIKYLELPSSLITSVLKENMNYFTIYSEDKKNLLPYYIGVANYKCDKIENMIEGTKDVVSGRLDDGTFYYETDLATPIASFREGLKNQTFQYEMGTLFEKSERLINLANLFYDKHPENSKAISINLNVLEQASKYCKADLKSGCVQEFPDEMQGIMGGILVRNQKPISNLDENDLVATAIEQHYLPNNAQSELPSNIHGVILSFLDKLDSLCYMINHGIEIKGNKDPFGMRRLAFSLARLIGLKLEQNSINWSIESCVELGLQNLSQFNVTIKETTKDKIIIFILDRVKSYLKEIYDVRAVESLEEKLITINLQNIIPFIKVLDERIKDPKFSLIESLNPYRRAKNLTSNIHSELEINPNLLKLNSEKNLYDVLIQKKLKLNSLFKNMKFNEILTELEQITSPLAVFFDQVMVNDPDELIKENRLALLLLVCKIYEEIANFSLLQVS